MQKQVFFIIVLIFIFLNSTSLYCQITDSTAAKDKVSKTTFTVGLITSSNADFYGQVAEEQLPYSALAASLNTPIGVYFSGVAYRILNANSKAPFISASALGIGYNFDINKKLNADVNYTHNFYPSNSDILQAGVSGIASAELKYQHWAATKLVFDYLFGDELDYFFTLSNSKNFDFNVSSEKAILSLTPEINIVAGTQQFYQTYLISRHNKGKGKGEPPLVEQTSQYKKLGIVSYNFKFPISYNRSNYLLELAYQLSLLGKNSITNAGNTNSFVTLSAYYQF